MHLTNRSSSHLTKRHRARSSRAQPPADPTQSVALECCASVSEGKPVTSCPTDSRLRQTRTATSPSTRAASSGPIAQPVTNAGFGDEELGPRRIRLDLFPQFGHVHADVVRVCGVGGAPHFLQDLSMREHLTRMLCKQDQQFVLDRSEMKVLCTPKYLALDQVDLEFTKFVRRHL